MTCGCCLLTSFLVLLTQQSCCDILSTIDVISSTCVVLTITGHNIHCEKVCSVVKPNGQCHGIQQQLDLSGGVHGSPCDQVYGIKIN